MLEKQLKQRYLNNVVEFLQDGLYVGEYLEEGLTGKLIGLIGGRRYKISTKYYHYLYDLNSDQLQKMMQCCTPLDDGKTYQFLEGAFGGTPIEPLDEKFKVMELSLDDNQIIFFLRADQLRHGGAQATATRRTKTTSTPSGSSIQQKEAIYKGQWGVEYHFMYMAEVIKSGEYDKILADINEVLLPHFEAAEHKKSRPVAAQQPAQQIEVKPGMTKEEVMQGLGEPLSIIKFGSKEVLKYPDFSVILENGKVVDIKI